MMLGTTTFMMLCLQLLSEISIHRPLVQALSSPSSRSLETQYSSEIIAGGTTVNDDTPAIHSKLLLPLGIAYSPLTRDVYICDGNRIRKISYNNETNIITSIAGNSSVGYGGDYMLALTNSILNTPYAIAVSPISNDVYFTDTKNHRIRQILLSSNGTIITVAGNGVAADFGSECWPATNCSLNSPSGIAISLDNEIYISDTGNHKIRKILRNGTIVTIAGISGNGGFNGDGLATNCKLNGPSGIAVSNNSREVYFSDTKNHRIRKIGLDGSLTTIAGNGQNGFNGDGVATNSKLNYPRGLVLSENDDVYLCDTNNHRIRKISVSGSITTIAGTGTNGGFEGDGSLAVNAKFNSPYYITLTPNHELLITDTYNYRIRNISLVDNIVRTIAGYGDGDGYQAKYSHLIVGELFFSTLTSDFNYVALSPNNEIYIQDMLLNRVRKIDVNGIITTVVPSGSIGGFTFYNSPGISITKNNEMILADSDNDMIMKMTSNGVISPFAGGGSNAGDGMPALQSRIVCPCSVAVSPLTGEVFFVESYRNRIRKIDSSGNIIRIAGTGNNGFSGDGGPAINADLDTPDGIVIATNGEIFVSDTYNHRLRKIFTNGTIVTIAGTGNYGYSGDGGSALLADLHYPRSINVVPSGEVFFIQYSQANSYTSVIRKISKDGNITSLVSQNSDCNANQLSCTLNNIAVSNFGEVIATWEFSLQKLTPFCSSQNLTLNDFGQCESPQCFGIDSNSSLVCSTHGVCEKPDRCSCFPGYNGSECQWIDCYGILDVNSSYVCSSHGICSHPNNCTCTEGYFGLQCEQTTCFGILNTNATAVCSGHERGYCSSFNNCTCHEGYQGIMCELSQCFGLWSNSSETCSSNGNCTSYNTCTCFENYFGINCQVTSCFGKLSNDSAVCSSNGNCTSSNWCSCFSDYFGPECEITSCYGIFSNDSMVCSSKGRCVAHNSCSCDEGYHGRECEIMECFGLLSNDSNVCSSNGNCTSLNHCTCNESYSGIECQIAQCFGWWSNDTNVCNNRRGNCTKFNHCECQEHYYGRECEVTECYGHYSNSSQACSSSQGKCVSFNNCSCDPEYYGDECQLFQCFGHDSTNDPLVCSGHGNCTGPNHCECMAEYFGPNCSTTTCFGLTSNTSTVCNNHGRCVNKDFCLCSEDFYGLECNVTTCFGKFSNDSSVCNSHGNCISKDQCHCRQGYEGTECEISYCFGILGNVSNVCSGAGNCTSLNNCTCFDNYFGHECELTTCFGVSSNDSSAACSGNNRGRCTKYNNCECKDSYSGNRCQFHKCFGIWNNDSSVCSSKGNCSDINICECDANYFGRACNLTTCYGIQSDASSVCSSKGECVAPNICHCFENYYGSKCEVTECFELASNSSHSCSSRGTCIEFNKCQCFEHYFGPKCEQTTCFGQRSNQSNVVCSNRGNCTDFNVCTCKDSYFGQNCELHKCFGIPSNSSQVCSSNGNCTDTDTCLCFPHYSGFNCSADNPNIIVPGTSTPHFTNEAIFYVVAVIAPIAVAALFLVLLGLIVIIIIVVRRKKKKERNFYNVTLEGSPSFVNQEMKETEF